MTELLLKNRANANLAAPEGAKSLMDLMSGYQRIALILGEHDQVLTSANANEIIEVLKTYGLKN